MTDDRIDQAIGAYTEDLQPSNEATPEVLEDNGEPTAPDEVPETTAEEVWPKKAVNALSRRDKQIGKQKAQIEALMRDMESLRNAIPKEQPKQEDPAPSEHDFNDIGSYLQAVAKHEAKKQLATERQSWEQNQRQNMESAQRNAQQAQFAQWAQEREANIYQQAAQAAETIPDFRDVLMENADFLDNMPAHIEMAFLESEDAAAAFYNLAKEGKLEALMAMPPYRAAMEIGKAQSIKPAKKVSAAPAPMDQSKPTGTATKPLHLMSGDELRKWVNS